MGKERELAFSFTCLQKHFKKSKGPGFFSFPLKSTNCSSWKSLAGVNPQLFSRWRTFFQKSALYFLKGQLRDSRRALVFRYI